MSRFKPQVTYMTHESLNDYYNSYSWNPKPKYIVKEYSTYAELKKDLPEICKSNIDLDGVHVVRSKRGQWGEWNENWEVDNNNELTIIKEGWS